MVSSLLSRPSTLIPFHKHPSSCQKEGNRALSLVSFIVLQCDVLPLSSRLSDPVRYSSRAVSFLYVPLMALASTSISFKSLLPLLRSKGKD
jgi:hypothetical protein